MQCGTVDLLSIMLATFQKAVSLCSIHIGRQVGEHVDLGTILGFL